MIRDAVASDVNAIAELHAKSWSSAYRGILSDDYLDNRVHQERLEIWRERFSAEHSKSMFVTVADSGGRLAGFACVFPNEDSIWGSFLDNLHVAPELIGQGIGRQLLSEAARRLLVHDSRAGLYFWVLEQNHRARRFYEKSGAVTVGSAQHLMPDGQRVLALRCRWADLAKILLSP